MLFGLLSRSAIIFSRAREICDPYILREPSTNQARRHEQKIANKYDAVRSRQKARSLKVIDLPDANTGSFWVILEVTGGPAPGTPHQIPLHRHDFYVLGAGVGIFSDLTTLNYINPPRRVVAMLPAKGYLFLAFLTDNAGA